MKATAHAALGASKAERWMNCPGSVRLSAGLPETISVYAQEGTAAHALAERALRKGLDADVWLDTEIEGVTVTEEMCEAVQVYLDYVRGNADTLDIAVEQRFDLSPLNPPGPMFGTADCVLWDTGGRLHVIDYKHGQGVAVDAHENAQLMFYALGVVVTMRVRPATITTTIVQPRASHPDGIIRSYDFDFDELKAFKVALFAAAEATLAPDAPLNPGEWCRFCPAQAVCPAQQQTAVELAQSEFDVFAPTVPEALTLEQLDRVLRIAPLVEDWIGAVRQHVKTQLENGIDVPGWKLVLKRATRRWKDEGMAGGYLEAALGGDAYTRKLLSPAQAEKRLKAIGAPLDDELDELVEKQSSGSNIVPATDARPALTPATSAQDEFAAVTESQSGQS